MGTDAAVPRPPTRAEQVGAHLRAYGGITESVARVVYRIPRLRQIAYELRLAGWLLECSESEAGERVYRLVAVPGEPPLQQEMHL